MGALIRAVTSRRTTFLALGAAVLATGWYAATPEPAEARRTGCTQVCLGFRGPCVWTPEEYFCHGANPPWYGCESYPYSCQDRET